MEKPKQPAPKPFLGVDKEFWRNPFVVLLSAIVLFLSAQILGALLVSPVALITSSQTYQTLSIIFGSLIAAFVLLSLAMKLIGFSWKSIGWVRPTAKNILLVIPAFAVYFVASGVFTVLATKLLPHFNVNQTQNVGFSNLQHPGELIAAFVSLSICTPILEETVFRGVLFKGLRRRLPFWASALITSVVFAIAHLQWNVAVDVFALSLALCYLTEKTESVIPGMLLHSLKNTLAFALLFVVK